MNIESETDGTCEIGVHLKWREQLTDEISAFADCADRSPVLAVQVTAEIVGLVAMRQGSVARDAIGANSYNDS